MGVAENDIINPKEPQSLLDDMKTDDFAVQRICELNNIDTINEKKERLVKKELNPYNDDLIVTQDVEETTDYFFED